SCDEATGLIERACCSDQSHGLRKSCKTSMTTWISARVGIPLTLAVGFDLNRLRFDHVYWVSQATTFLDPYEPDVGTFSYFPGGYNYINRFHADQHAFFVENHLEVTPRLSLLAGIRKDRYDVKRFERLTGVGSAASFDPS